MKRARRPVAPFLSLDSLVDIVTNNVGILIILAAFMALFALMAPGRAVVKSEPPRVTPPPPLLQVPWSHPTSKQTLFFFIRDNRIQYIDLKAVYERLLALPAGRRAPLSLTVPGVSVRFFPVTNQVYCFEFTPRPGAGETWAEARGSGSRWRQALSRYPREGFVYFFWVAGDSFELFRDVRASLLERQVEVGWKPVKKDALLEVCSGFEGASAFQPQ